jgi:PAS domain S-box-containing protein
MRFGFDEKFFRTIFDNVYNGIYVVDGEGRTLLVNKTYEKMSGFANEELVGKTLYDLVHHYKYFSGAASLLVLERKKPATITYKTKTGKNLLVKGRPILNDNNEIELIINTIWDLTVIKYNDVLDKDTARDSYLKEEGFIATSEKMTEVIDTVLKLSNTSTTILLTGETGVGKSVVAELVHRTSNRKNNKFLKVNCGAIPEGLIESELFGYEPGAFTGADKKGKLGIFESADKGTVFLDEISELPFSAQSKLLLFLQDKEFFKIGGRKSIKTDTRIIAATNKNLWELVKNGKFREDLYYRLNVIPINVPALRERTEDIPVLAKYFLNKFNQHYHAYKYFSEELLEAFQSFDWPGNVRELENVIERLILLSPNQELTTEDFYRIQKKRKIVPEKSLQNMLDKFEYEILVQAKKEHVTTRNIAKSLGISQPKVVRLLKKHSLN